MTLLEAACLDSSDDLYDYISYRINNEELQKRISLIALTYSENLVNFIKRCLLIEEEQRPDWVDLEASIDMEAHMKMSMS